MVLNTAIKDAIQNTPGYREKAILVSQVLEATGPVVGENDEVYAAIHKLFSAIPARLVHGSMFLVTTQDLDHGVELVWDAREEPRGGYVPGQGLQAPYEPHEPIALALGELERVCEMRAGSVRASYEQVASSSSFPRRPFLHRRVVALLPFPRDVAEARARARQEQRDAPQRVDVTVTTDDREPTWRSLWPKPRPMAPLPTLAKRAR